MMKASRLVLALFVVLLKVEACGAFLIRNTPLRLSRHASLTKNASRLKPVEQVDLESGKIIKTYDSIAEAANAIGSSPSNIGEVVRGRRRTAAGFFWRPKGDLDHKKFPRPRKLHPWTTPCEQIDMKTLQVVAVYPSAALAAKSVNGRRQSISRILNGAKQRSSYKGFYWRKVGDTSSKPRPAADREQKISSLQQPVQQICPDTRSVIATFDSAAEAGRSLDIKAYMISKVLRGVQHTTGGFHFRAVGKPREFKKDCTPRSVHQISLDTGDIIHTFSSLSQAGKALGVIGASISGAAHGKTKTSAGYRWEFAEKKAVDQDENRNNT